MRNFKTTIIAVICLLITIGAFFAVKVFVLDDGKDNGGDNPSQTPSDKTKVEIFEFDKEKVVKIESKNEEFFSLYYADGKWNSKSHTEIEIYDSSVESFIDDFCGLSGYIIKDYDSLDDFGLKDSSMYTTLTLEDGTVFTVRFGITDNKESYRYITVDGVKDTIYSISKLSADSIIMTKKHLVRMEALSFSSDYNPSYFIIKKGGELMLSAQGVYVPAETEDMKDTVKWTVTEPIEIAANDDNMNNLVKSLRDVPLASLYDGACEDISEYGLDKPTIEYSIVYSSSSGKKESKSIALGNKTKDSSQYYCIIDGNNSFIYTVNASYIMVDITLEDYIDGKLFYDMYTDLSTVNLTFGGKSHTMKFVFGEDKKEERFFDGVFVHDEDSYQDENLDTPEDKFNHLLASMYLVGITTVDSKAPTEKGELLFKAEYKKIDGKVITVECYKRDDTTAYLYKNGEYFGGYMKTAERLYGDYEDYGIKGALEKVIDAMK
ncbi:MAG: DUF4340 domain-containing protein [Ruminococcaceae bacterium]|nr:DUF4340 domain-containing protein [Oscillospiraceae bacterium]